ncbi:acyl-ACP desaturase [soil metagenome]
MAEKTLLFPDVDLNATDAMFLDALGAESERLLNRHDDSPREFFPSDVIDQMEEAIRLGDKPGALVSPEEAIAEEVKSSLYVNYITEEGLPYYTSAIDRNLPKKHPFRDWLNTWTAEEGRHGPSIVNFLHFSRQFDMHVLERARMAMMKRPDTPQPDSFVEGIIYPAFQEPATEVSHRNTMRLLPRAHKIGKNMLANVIGDEVKHGLFYRGITASALEYKPSLVMVGIARQINGFAMPGKSIPGFKEHKETIRKAGIFGPVQLKAIYDEMLTEKWNIWNISGLDENGEKARDFLAEYLRKMGKAIEWAAQKQASKAAV